MNREILFRGKSIDNGEWAQGHLFKIWDDVFILWGTTNGVPNQIQVDPKTVGQSTGLLDKNGKTIFEGDVVVSIYQNYKHEIIFANACFMWGKLPLMVEDDEGVTLIEESSWCEVIGNIHDNPTLLKAEV